MIRWRFLEDGVTGMDVIGLVCLLAIVSLLTYAHFRRDNPIDLRDLLVDRVGGERKELTRSSFASFLATIVGTFAFLYSLVDGGLDKTWAGIAAWMGVMYGYRVADKVTAPQGSLDGTPPVGGR